MALVCFSVVIRWTLTKPVTLGQFCNFCQCQNIVLGDGQQDVSNADIWQKQKIMLIYKGFKSPFLDDWFVSLLTITSFFLCVLLHQIRSEIMMDLIMLCVWWICFLCKIHCLLCLSNQSILFVCGWSGLFSLQGNLWLAVGVLIFLTVTRHIFKTTNALAWLTYCVFKSYLRPENYKHYADVERYKYVLI